MLEALSLTLDSHNDKIGYANPIYSSWDFVFYLKCSMSLSYII